MLNVLRLLLIAATSIVGFYFAPFISKAPSAPFWGVIFGFGAGFLIVLAEILLERYSAQTLVAATMGLIAGLIGGNLFAYALSQMVEAPEYLYALIVLICGYIGTMLGAAKLRDIPLLSSVAARPAGGAGPNVLDTSVIIDGRVADVIESGFLPGTVIIPRFVLKEIQLIADSSNPLRRNRGRRALEILNKIQKSALARVEIFEKDYADVNTVDEKLLRLSKELDANLVTNDYNLNQVAELQGVKILNLNDLANALKAVVLPGEMLAVQVVKEGKEPAQGVAYLDDGTMVVVENGRGYIGESLEVLVTSVLQTAAGRMIFGKIPGAEDYVSGG
ncbi:MAG: TRAM domain-containing protein [candidate division Zixibacteria bacterium]|nr:TRAM domain-containing protein [candidate division Zixibacteria bacterium]